ncbi:quinone oxidoreductase [Demequina sp. NBRC 110051]|uniref:quinone oxidoreductase family protein n=1 Tax=Demequina sp. NBRC 110051 TaxID=1570340 RepID=UPI000A060BF5|nr:quinone oxidoreductase [Demequina sp. NBRC 110051]
MRAVVVSSPGPASAMEVREVDPPTPGPGEVLVDVQAAGVNFIDTYQRSGVYPVEFPWRPGSEGAGVVAGVGEGVTEVAVGDRVAWCSSPGSYAEQVCVKTDDLYPVPAGVDLTTAAAAMLQGLTAHYLATSTFPLGPGDTALVHAGAGGVGLLLTQLARARGARVITTVSSEDKERLSREAGADEVIRYDRFADMTSDLPAAVRALTSGNGVTVVYDGVGAATFEGSLASLAVSGTLVLFGGASGQVPPFDLQRLNAGGSLFVTRPTLGHHLRTPEERRWRSTELFGAIEGGDLTVRIGATFGLEHASSAHEALEGRATTGKVLLLSR